MSVPRSRTWFVNVTAGALQEYEGKCVGAKTAPFPVPYPWAGISFH